MNSCKYWSYIVPVVIHVVFYELERCDGVPIEGRYLIFAGLYHWHSRECIEELKDAVENCCIDNVRHDLE